MFFRREICVVVLFCTITVLSVFYFAAFLSASEKPPLNVAVMVSDDHYDADKLLPPLMQKLGKENHWNVKILHGHGQAEFSNINVLDDTDVLVIYVRRLALPQDQLEKVKRYVASGRGVVGLRTASHAFESKNKTLPENAKNWPEFDKEILGGNYHNHGKNELGSDIKNVAEQVDSLILKDVSPETWHSAGSLYFTDPIADDATLYQVGSTSQQQNVPVTWTRMYGKTRVAYTALGHQKDFDVPAFQTLLRNLVHWTGGETKN